MNIHLTRPLEDYVRQRVTEGGYSSASELIREALRLLQDYEKVKQQRLREMIAVGEEAIARGEVTEIQTGDQLDEFFGRL